MYEHFILYWSKYFWVRSKKLIESNSIVNDVSRMFTKPYTCLSFHHASGVHAWMTFSLQIFLFLDYIFISWPDEVCRSTRSVVPFLNKKCKCFYKHKSEKYLLGVETFSVYLFFICFLFRVFCIYFEQRKDIYVTKTRRNIL